MSKVYLHWQNLLETRTRTGSSKLRAKFESLKREIKAGVKKQHDLYVNNLIGDIKASTGTLIVKRRTYKVSHL